MGISSRDYYRESVSGSGGWGLYSLTPVVKSLIVSNIVIFVLQIVTVRKDGPTHMAPAGEPAIENQDGPTQEAWEAIKRENPQLCRRMIEAHREALDPDERISVIQKWFELDTNMVIRSGQVWRLVTSAFCHDRYSILHIVFNMLLLFWFGGTLETMYGSREFLLFYLSAAVFSALTFIVLDLYTGSAIPAVGASGAVIGVMMLYTIHFPRETICVCWFFPIEMRWLMTFYLIYDLHPILLMLSGDRMMTGIAHAAHLGGLAFGYLYAHFQWRLDVFGDRLPWPRQTGTRTRYTSKRSSCRLPDGEMDRVDQILQKISENGEASLTDDERNELQNASERMKYRSKRNR